MDEGRDDDWGDEEEVVFVKEELNGTDPLVQGVR